MRRRRLAGLCLGLSLAAGQAKTSQVSWAAGVPAGEVLSGVDVLIENGFQELKGKRVGLITNQTGKTKSGQLTVHAFAETPAVELKALFSPEHGFFGAIEDAAVSSDTLKLPDGRTIPLFSLYGSSLAPTPDMLSGLDALVFDIQDIGARFYTYAATMAMAMEAAAASDLDFYILDRPNPINGRTLEGPILSPDIRHFTAYFPVPIRHGLTMGEIARLHNSLGKVGARLHVVPLKGWTRELWYDETGLPWTKPSPNMPDLESATLYPGVACLEYTNISVGRGVPAPFRWIGAPWLDADGAVKRLRSARLAGITFEREDNTPAKSVFKGEKCRGVRMKVTHRDSLRPTEVFAHLICAVRDLHPMEFKVNWDATRRMVGTDEFKRLYESGAGPGNIIRLFREGPKEFERTRGPFLLY